MSTLRTRAPSAITRPRSSRRRALVACALSIACTAVAADGRPGPAAIARASARIVVVKLPPPWFPALPAHTPILPAKRLSTLTARPSGTGPVARVTRRYEAPAPGGTLATLRLDIVFE